MEEKKKINQDESDSEMDFDRINSEESQTEGLDAMTTDSMGKKSRLKIADADRFLTRDEELTGRYEDK